MKRRLRWIAVGLLLAAGAAGWVLAGIRADQARRAEADLAAAQLEAAGAVQAIVGRDADLARLSDEIVRLGIAAPGSRPAAAVRTVTRRVEVPVPIPWTCPPPEASQAATLPPTATAETLPPHPDPGTVPLGVSARHELGAVLAPGGGLFVSGRQWVTLDRPGWEQTVELPVESTEAAVSADLARALRGDPWPRWSAWVGAHTDGGAVVGGAAWPFRARWLRRVGLWGSVETGSVSRYVPSYDGYHDEKDLRGSAGVAFRW